jgi:hypothetical protein
MPSLFRRLTGSRPDSAPRAALDPVQAAQDNLLNKATKLDLAEKAVMVKHLADVAEDEVRAVQSLRAKHLGPEFARPKPKGDDVNDIIVGDDIHLHGRPPVPPSRAWPLAAGLALGGGLIALALGYTRPPAPTPAPAAQPPASSNTTIEKKSGFLLDLPGATK